MPGLSAWLGVYNEHVLFVMIVNIYTYDYSNVIVMKCIIQLLAQLVL